MKLTLDQQYMLSVLHSQYNACWCYGEFRSQGINRHGWYWPPKPEYSISSITRINVLLCGSMCFKVISIQIWWISNDHTRSMLRNHTRCCIHTSIHPWQHFLEQKKKVISIQISLKFVPKDPIYRQSSLVQVMAWLQTDDKPLTEQMMSSLLIYFCVTRPPWVKGYLPAVGGGVVPLSTIRLGWRPLAATTVMSFNTLRPRQNGRHFADDTFKRIFMNENVRISINISLKCVPKCLINNIPALVQIMAWRWPGNKPLSEPMMVSLPTHICVTRPLWVNPCCAEFILGNVKHTGLILGLCPVNERRHYSVTPFLIGWAQT